MYQQIYYIDKSTDTFADVLAVYGLATILSQIVAEREIDTRIRDSGSYYSVALDEPLQAEWVENCLFFSHARFILTGKMKQRGDYPQDLTHPVDYEAEKQRRANYFEARKQLPPEAKRPGATPDEFPELLALNPPHPEWGIWAQVNQMSAISAYNGMVTAWHEARDCFPEQLKLILQMCATTPNDVEGAMASWKKLAKEHNLSASPLAAATQVYNPATGKGANRPKADNLTIGGQKNFWLLEYLKLVGMPHAGLPRVVSGSKDRKTYVLLPVNIKLSTSNKTFRRFQDVLWANSAIKMDIMAALKYTQTFLEQWRDGQLNELDAMMDIQPGNFVQGLAMAFYKDMGSAHAILNQSTINLPRWMQVSSKEEAQVFINLLAEHEAVLRGFQEERSLEYDMLRTYRDFLSGAALRHFFEFTAAYSSHLTNKIERKEPIKQFTTTNLEVLMMAQDKKLKPILESGGFQNVANAIRQSTVVPQRAKASGKVRVYDIRYGLGNDLKRKANYNEEFVQALTDFMHSYNQENVQVEENHKGNPPYRRKQLTTTDIDEVVALIDEHGAKTVGNMLVAFGYARVPRDDE